MSSSTPPPIVPAPPPLQIIFQPVTTPGSPPLGLQTAPARRRGRPKGSKNKVPRQPQAPPDQDVIRRPRGRPKGSTKRKSDDGEVAEVMRPSKVPRRSTGEDLGTVNNCSNRPTVVPLPHPRRRVEVRFKEGTIVSNISYFRVADANPDLLRACQVSTIEIV